MQSSAYPDPRQDLSKVQNNINYLHGAFDVFKDTISRVDTTHRQTNETLELIHLTMKEINDSYRKMHVMLGEVQDVLHQHHTRIEQTQTLAWIMAALAVVMFIYSWF